MFSLKYSTNKCVKWKRIQFFGFSQEFQFQNHVLTNHQVSIKSEYILLLFESIYFEPLRYYYYYHCLEEKMKMVNWLWKKNPKQAKEEEQVDEQQLKKKGFNPQGLEIQQIKQSQLFNFDKDYQGYITPSAQEAAKLISQHKFYPNQDEHRHQHAYSKGGKICSDKTQTSKIRSVGAEMIKIVGKKIISGDLNLTRISFPIKVMVPRTALENSTVSCCMNPYFMKKAVQASNPLERMKFVITNTISAFYHISMFLKPLNPVIGQTLQAHYNDGTQIYCQQVSHHPPISYFLAVGPQGSYRYYGCYNFSAHAGLNSANLTNKGFKVYQFPNGDRIDATFNKQTYSGVFMGTFRSQAVQTMYFVDKKNDMKAEITFGKVKKRPSDYFQSTITQKGKVVSSFEGSYCGYINFDNVRYWDGRFLKPFKLIIDDQSTLQSDYRRRKDLNLLKLGKMQQAQKAKEEIQENQRRDVKMRQKYGPKP